MNRLLIIPAAGRGSRLGLDIPKLMVPVGGRPMIDRLLELYAPVVDSAAVVVHPAAANEVQAHVAAAPFPVELFVQPEPTGMLDAILLAGPAVELSAPRRVLVTWCDQVAIRPETVERLRAAADSPDSPNLVMPTAVSPDPYVHLVRDERGTITAVLHRREGDTMPAVGEGDAGVFEMSREAYLDWLPLYAASPQIGARTGERNFVPFVVWVARRGWVVTFPCVEPGEAVGINTRDDLAYVEQMLRARKSGAS